ncbi:MAG: LysR family transcriptional regulator [Alphaproteobacteria bacterium]|nr:LysR family transcriptional regulator [Alphaproteobacteria bacterium]MBM3629457.1 LysR family transcriptional regulator [Alphaproteobacteria bacterium]
MQRLNLRHLGYFRAVAHAGGLTRAAGLLGVSQSALSLQIRTLEQRIGHALFERVGRALRLTEAGRIALDRADAIHATAEDLVATLGGSGVGRAALRVGALATLSRNFQLAFVRPLLGQAGLRLSLRAGSAAELLAELRALDLDVVLLDRPPAAGPGPVLVAHRVARQRVELFGTPRRLARAGGDLADLLRRHPVIVPGPQSGIGAGFAALAERIGVAPRITAEVDDMAMLRLLARQDAGLAVLPPIVVKDELRAGLLRRAARLPGLVEAFYAVTVPRRFANPLLALLLRARTAELER